MSTEDYRTAHVRLPAWLYSQISKIAKKEKRSMNATVELALEHYLDEQDMSFDERMESSLADEREGRIRHYTSVDALLKATTPSEEGKHVPA